LCTSVVVIVIVAALAVAAAATVLVVVGAVVVVVVFVVNPLNAGLNPICHLLALIAHPIFHVSRIRVKNYC
jgi:hypothetical protein